MYIGIISYVVFLYDFGFQPNVEKLNRKNKEMVCASANSSNDKDSQNSEIKMQMGESVMKATSASASCDVGTCSISILIILNRHFDQSHKMYLKINAFKLLVIPTRRRRF